MERRSERGSIVGGAAGGEGLGAGPILASGEAAVGERLHHDDQTPCVVRLGERRTALGSRRFHVACTLRNRGTPADLYAERGPDRLDLRWAAGRQPNYGALRAETASRR
jgi:hypothetical protein